MEVPPKHSPFQITKVSANTATKPVCRGNPLKYIRVLKSSHKRNTYLFKKVGIWYLVLPSLPALIETSIRAMYLEYITDRYLPFLARHSLCKCKGTNCCIFQLIIGQFTVV